MLIQTILAQTSQEPQIYATKKVKRGKVLKYELVNNSKRSIYLFDPMQIKIEKNKNGTWMNLETPYCPCGRACPAPPDIKEVIPNEKVTFTWNLEESLCENNEEKKRRVKKGLYRVVFYYGENQQERKKIMRIFKVG
ncbi:hypothetical protein AD998_16665 [bacterium 336/3]|nr:hypothetical protein AD998_16665 [bacterium 336/3]